MAKRNLLPSLRDGSESVLFNLAAATGLETTELLETTGLSLSTLAGPLGLLVGAIFLRIKGRRASEREQKELHNVILDESKKQTLNIKELGDKLEAADIDASIDREIIIKHVKAIHFLLHNSGKDREEQKKNIEKHSKELATLHQTLENFILSQFRTQCDSITAVMDQGIAEVLKSLMPKQPHLVLNHDDYNPRISDLNPFVYRYRLMPLVGREKELDAITEFLGAPSLAHEGHKPDFRWWLALGQGGLGKSRLALDYCLQLQKQGEWHCGFLKQDKDFQPTGDWQPLRPTLLIVDYAGTRVEAVRSLALSLSNPNRRFDHPVRLLLLERSDQEIWFGQFMKPGDDGETLKLHRYSETPLRLSPVADDLLWTIITNLLAHVYKKGHDSLDRQSIIDSLRKIDSLGRPLFAAFAADALAAGRDIRQWDRKKLLQDVLEREELNRWQEVDMSHRHLLALATITGGIPLPDGSSDLFDDGELHGIIPQELVASQYEAMVGPLRDEHLPPLEPDILGELFVLEHFNKNLGGAQWKERIWSKAWQLAPLKTASFLVRAHKDWRTHKSLPAMRPPPVEDVLGINIQFWAMAVCDLITPLADSDGMSTINELVTVVDTSRVILPYFKASAHLRRGTLRGLAGDFMGAIEDYEFVICKQDAPIEMKAEAYLNRGILSGQAGKIAASIGDYSHVVNMQSVPSEVRAKALVSRAAARVVIEEDINGAIDDCDIVIQMLDAVAELRAMAFATRGTARSRSGDLEGALADFGIAINMKEASAEARAAAHYNRGVIISAVDIASAISDYTCVIEMQDAPVELKAKAYVNRGSATEASGDFTSVIEMESAPAEQKAMAYLNRGVGKGEKGDIAGEIADYTSVIEMQEAPAEQKANAHRYRALTRRQEGDITGAIDDATSVIEMQDAPASIVCESILMVGWWECQLNGNSKAGCRWFSQGRAFAVQFALNDYIARFDKVSKRCGCELS